MIPAAVLLVVLAASVPPAAADPPHNSLAPPGPNTLKDLGLEKRPPPTAADLASAKAQADAILAAANASDVFENVTTGAEPALRHKASGYVCAFTPGSPLNNVLIFHAPRGDSVGCNTGRGLVSLSLFLDRAPPGRPAVETLIGPLAAAIVHRLPDARPFGPVMVASDKALPPHQVVQLKRPSPRGDIEERLAVGYAGDWLIQQRVTQPVADSTPGDLLDELNFLGVQRAIVAAGKASTATPL